MDADTPHECRAAIKKSKEEKRVLRKQIRAGHTLLKHAGVRTATQPTKSLAVANGGLGNGVGREVLRAELAQLGEVENLVMPPHKPYAFVTYGTVENARAAHASLNGQKLQCGENSVTLYLSYVDSVTCDEPAPRPWPGGLTLLEDFVTPEEEALLLAAVDWSPSENGLMAQKALKHRQVKHYGFEFRYDCNNVDKDKPLAAGLPVECRPLLERCVNSGHVDAMPDQLTVNQYKCGQGIPPHVDTHSAFEDTILSLSLGSQTVMEFRHPEDGGAVEVVLPGRSLLVMKGESRFLWSHGITPRKFDMVPSSGELTLSKRETRTSFTFRRIRHEPCRCSFPSTCDSQGAPSAPATSLPSPPSLPRCSAAAAHLEKEYVHRVYDAIAAHFSSTRHSPWPRVCHFLSSLVPGSVMADVGCGNGKYLGVNPEIVAVGCDRSSSLVQICRQRGFQAFVSDALHVPLRTASCDACISIAVIHHFSTQCEDLRLYVLQERRLEAVRELVRLLKPGARGLIYVWAYEQEYKEQKSKYLKDYNKGHAGTCNPPARCPENGAPGVEVRLSVHTNRTPFASSDLLVPWHLKAVPGGGGAGEMSGSGSQPEGQGPDPGRDPAPVLHRYYHVFQRGELEALCAQVSGVTVQSSYHDQGNWCVVLERN